MRASYNRRSKEEVIVDISGKYSYAENPIEYMKARKYVDLLTVGGSKTGRAPLAPGKGKLTTSENSSREFANWPKKTKTSKY